MDSTQLRNNIEQAQKGDEQAFALVYDLYYDKIFAYSFRRILHHQAAEDVVSNTFLKVFNKLKNFEWRHEGSFNGWIYKIASNEILMYFRKESKYKSQIELPENFENTVSDEGSAVREIENNLLNDSRFRILHKGITKLSEKMQEILHLHYFESLTSKEIAETLDMKETTVRVSLHRAMQQLETLLKDEALEYTERTTHE